VFCEIIQKSGIVTKTITQPGDWDIEAFQLLPDYLALGVKKCSPVLKC
jgi:hypothetical protein